MYIYTTTEKNNSHKCQGLNSLHWGWSSSSKSYHPTTKNHPKAANVHPFFFGWNGISKQRHIYTTQVVYAFNVRPESNHEWFLTPQLGTFARNIFLKRDWPHFVEYGSCCFGIPIQWSMLHVALGDPPSIKSSSHHELAMFQPFQPHFCCLIAASVHGQGQDQICLEFGCGSLCRIWLLFVIWSNMIQQTSYSGSFLKSSFTSFWHILVTSTIDSPESPQSARHHQHELHLHLPSHNPILSSSHNPP